MVLPQGLDSRFGKTLSSFSSTSFPSPFAAIISSYFRRFSYLGDVLAALSKPKRFPRNGIKVTASVVCSNPKERFGENTGLLFGEQKVQKFEIIPTYLTVKDTLPLVPRGEKAPKVFPTGLGYGGKSVSRMNNAFNYLSFENPEEFESLLINARGKTNQSLEHYKKFLFPRLNGIILTIGRIPDLENFLPNGARRVISCNGIITNHEIDLTKGRNQEYVRCIDLVIDVDADLNYGKTQLTNTHLVKAIRDYINDAYQTVLQNAAGTWVGKIPKDDDEDTEGSFTTREDLGLSEFASKKIPRDENDVIALFFEILGKNILKDYRIYGLSQKNRYDCMAAIRRSGDPESVLEPKDDSKLRIVEFKLDATDVLSDFEAGMKSSAELDLLIAWTEGKGESSEYSMYDIQHSKLFERDRIFPGVTKYIEGVKDGSEVQVLLLDQIIKQYLETLKV